MTQAIRPDLPTPVLAPWRTGTTSAADGKGSFADLLRRAVGDASDLQDESQRLISAFVRGEPVDLHQVMAATEEANISLELLVEIRNKLTDAYRTVMNMS
jgi:flagellar hook-basal body complex protein FliE